MKKLVLGLAVSSVLYAGLAAAGEAAAVGEEKLQAYRAEVKTFFETLKGELQGAMKAGGPVAAIDVCNKRAGEIAAEHSLATGWKIARTSLKERNPNNAPDEWEAKILQSFEERKAAGEDPAKLEHAEIVDGADGQKQVRYMKAIPTAELCLACHGETIPDDVSAKLKELYPDDKATGFKAGDLRGAFTFTETLAAEEAAK